MAQFGEDCFYFYNSQCMKGSKCTYRHCEIARNSSTICPYWLEGQCNIPWCSYRHTEVISKPNLPVRDEMPCFWEGKQGRCTRPNCMYKHLLPRPGDPPLAPPLVVPQQRMPNPAHKKPSYNVITLVDATDHGVTKSASQSQMPSGNLPVVPDMSVPPPNVQRIPTIKPVIVNTAEDSDIDSPYSSPVKKPVEWKDVEPKRPVSNLKDLTPKDSEQNIDNKTNSSGQSIDNTAKSSVAGTSQTKTETETKQISEAPSDTKPTNTLKKNAGTKKTSLKTQSNADIKQNTAGDKEKPGPKVSCDKPKTKIIRTKPGSSKSPSSGSSQSVTKATGSRSADSAVRRRRSREQSADRGLRRNSKSPGNRPLKLVTGKPKIISLKKSNKATATAAPKVKSDTEEEDLGIKSLEQTLRERALKSMGIIELKSGRVIRINEKKRRSTEKKDQIAVKRRRSEETAKKRHHVEDESGKNRNSSKKDAKPEESLEEDGEEEGSNGSSGEESANSEDEKASSDDDDLGEEEEIELGEPYEATNSDDDVSVEGDESKEDTEEEEEEEEAESVKEQIVSGSDQRKTILTGTDRRKAILTKGSALENFTIKKVVPIIPNKENRETEKPKRKRRVILEDEEMEVKTASVISVVKPSVKNRLGIVLSEPSKSKKAALDSGVSTNQSKDVPVASETKPAAQVAKPTKSLNVWSRRTWKGKEDSSEYQSRTGQTSASQDDSNTQVPIKRRMGWRKTGRDETSATGFGEEDEVQAIMKSTVKSESRKLKRPLQIYVPPALKKVSQVVAEDPPVNVNRGSSQNMSKRNENKLETRKEPVKTFAQIMAEKRQKRQQMKDSDSIENTQQKKYTPIKFGIEPDELDTAPKMSASATESAISPLTVSTSLSDTNLVKTKTDKTSRWRKKLKTKDVPPLSSMDYKDGVQSIVDYKDSVQSLVDHKDSVQSIVDNSDNSQQQSLHEKDDVDKSLSKSETDTTYDANDSDMILNSPVYPPLQTVADNMSDTLPAESVPETVQKVVSNKEIAPSKRSVHSESDSWLDLDVDDLELDVSGGDTKDEDLLKEIDELLA